MKYTAALAIAVVVACGSAPRSNTPSNTAPRSPPTETALETGSATACSRDADCYCREFDGAEFGPGRDSSTCCLAEAGCTDALGAPVSANHCMPCVYD